MNWKKIKSILFPTPINGVVSVLLLILMTIFFFKAFNWLVVDAVWNGDAGTCRNAEGACVAFLKDKFTFLIFGLYPRESLARPAIFLFSFFALVGWSMRPGSWTRNLLFFWVGFIPLSLFIMGGGFLGLDPVPTSKWGGLPLTILLSMNGLIFSYPLGVTLALGRRSGMPLIKSFCIAFIELIRGVPLISVLFMSSVMFPLFLPDGVNVNKLMRAQVAIILFISAYMAEVVRGGLAAVPKGQVEAAQALGMGSWQITWRIVLPQAVRIVVPPTINTAIGMFKDTSLVVIIALFDLMGTTKSSLTDYKWLGFSVEAYLFTALVYFVICFGMGSYGRFLEKYFNKDQPA